MSNVPKLLLTRSVPLLLTARTAKPFPWFFDDTNASPEMLFFTNIYHGYSTQHQLKSKFRSLKISKFLKTQ